MFIITCLIRVNILEEYEIWSKRIFFLLFRYCCFRPTVGFPMQKGRHEFQNTPTWIEDQCDVIKFKPFVFYPHMEIYVQLTVNHFNYTYADWVHEATTPWVESLNITQFTACVTRTGKNKYLADSFASVDWVAYQGAPSGGVAGKVNFSTWWTGTSCRTVSFPKVCIPL